MVFIFNTLFKKLNKTSVYKYMMEMVCVYYNDILFSISYTLFLVHNKYHFNKHPINDHLIFIK